MQNTPLQSFGIHQATFKDISDPTYWAMAKVLGSAEPDLKPESVDNNGGSALVPFASAPGRASGEMTLTVRQYDAQLLKFLAPWVSAAQVEDADGEAAGSVTAITNSVGTSVVDATTGIASIAVGTAASLSPGNYKVVCTAAATIDIYVDTDLTGQVEYQDSSLKINSSAITIPGTDGTVEYQGIEFTGGSGSIAMTTGDIATFTVNPISTYLLDYKIGKAGACQREFSLTIYSECVGGKYARVTYPRCVGRANTTPQFLEKEWSSMEATIKILQPSTVDYVAQSTFFNR